VRGGRNRGKFRDLAPCSKQRVGNQKKKNISWQQKTGGLRKELSSIISDNAEGPCKTEAKSGSSSGRRQGGLWIQLKHLKYRKEQMEGSNKKAPRDIIGGGMERRLRGDIFGGGGGQC